MSGETNHLRAIDDVLDDMDINEAMDILAFNVASRFAAMFDAADPIRRPIQLAHVMTQFNAQIFDYIDSMWWPEDEALVKVERPN